MMLRRKLAAFLTALMLLLVPAIGGGGDGGLVNLPGGGGARSIAPTTPPLLVSHHTVNKSITMVLPSNFFGAVALVELEPNVVVPNATFNGTYTLHAEQLQRWSAIGIRRLQITFVSPTLEQLLVVVELSPTTSSVVLSVH